jgi:uncharacterized protein involved in outer membrane biogenesis
LRKAAIVLGILVISVLAGLGFAPQLLDLEPLKGPIAAQLSARAGRKVELAGSIGLRLLPSPALTARDVRLANPPGAAVPDMVRLRALEVKPALLPLLAGRLEVRSAVLVEPEIDIERLPNGEVNWLAAASMPAPASGRAEAGAPRPAMVTALVIDELTVQNGAVTDRLHSGVERFEHINASLSLDDASRQLSAAGSLVARGAAVSFQLHTGVVAAAKLPLQLTVTTTPTAQLQLDLVLAGAADDRRVSGRFKLAAADARAVLGTLAQVAVPAVLAQPVAISGDISGSPQQLALDRLSVDIGPAHGDGSFHLDAGAIPALGLALSIGRLDLDHWPVPGQAALAPVSLLAGALAATPQAGLPTPAPRGASGFALPKAINAKLDVGVDALVWRGGLIRDARLTLALVDGAVTLERFTALLPGGSDVSLRGSGTTTAEGLRGQGMAEVNADDLRALFGWFAVSLGPVPPDRLRSGKLSSRFALDGDRLDLAAIDVVIDSTRLNGAATVLLQQRPGIGLRLTADRFNLDAYLPLPAASSDDNRPTTSTAADMPTVRAVDAGGGLAAFDANIDARVQSLTWHGQPLGEVHLAGTLQNDEATIRELTIGDVGGASANLSGVIAGVAAVPTGQLAFDVHGPELERVLRLVAPQLASGRSYGAFSLGGGMQVDTDTVTLDTDLQLLEGHAHMVGDIARPSGKLDLGFDLDHPSFGRLLRGFAPVFAQADGDPGPVKLAGRVSGQGRRFSVERIALAIGPGTLEGKLGVDLSGARPQISADITVGDWAIDRLLPSWQLLNLGDVDVTLAGRSLVYGRWHIDRPALAVSVKGGALALQRLSGSLFGGTVEASGEFGGTVKPALRGRLALRDADLRQALNDAAGLGLIDGHFDIDADVAGTGSGSAEMIASLAGAATLHAHDGSISGVTLKAMNDQLAQHPTDLLASLRGGAGGRTAFSTLKGTFRLADGIARSDDLHLAAEGGDGTATVSVDLPKWTMATKVDFRLAAAANAPPLVMHIDGAIDQPRIVLDVNALEKFLSQTVPQPP